MRTLEDRLERDSDHVRRQIAEMPLRPVTIVGDRARRRRLSAAAATFVLILGGFGAASLFMTGRPDNPVASHPSSAAQPATTTSNVGDDVPKTAPLSALPMLGLDLEEWVPADASENDDDGGFRTVSYYLPGELGTPLMVAKLWVRGIPVGSPYEEGMWWTESPDYETMTLRGTEARMFATDGAFEIVWRESEDVVVTVAVISASQAVTREQAAAIANAITELDRSLWTELLEVEGDPIPASPTTTLAG